MCEIASLEASKVNTAREEGSASDSDSISETSVAAKEITVTDSKTDVESDTDSELLETSVFNTVHDESTAPESDPKPETSIVAEESITMDSNTDTESDTDSNLDTNTETSSVADDSILTPSEKSASARPEMDTPPPSPCPELTTETPSSVERSVAPAMEPLRQRAKTIASGDVLRELSLLGSLGFRELRSGREGNRESNVD